MDPKKTAKKGWLSNLYQRLIGGEKPNKIQKEEPHVYRSGSKAPKEKLKGPINIDRLVDDACELRDLGISTLEKSELEYAKKVFRACLLQRLDASSPISKAEVFFHLGEIAYYEGEPKKALSMLERAIDLGRPYDKAQLLRDKINGE
jgi:tetratricopeptide (TPR) repeat protein